MVGVAIIIYILLPLRLILFFYLFCFAFKKLAFLKTFLKKLEVRIFKILRRSSDFLKIPTLSDTLYFLKKHQNFLSLTKKRTSSCPMRSNPALKQTTHEYKHNHAHDGTKMGMRGL